MSKTDKNNCRPSLLMQWLVCLQYRLKRLFLVYSGFYRWYKYFPYLRKKRIQYFHDTKKFLYILEDYFEWKYNSK